MSNRLRALGCLVVLLGACAQNSSGYDPNWDSASPIAGGKADSVLDELQVLALGDTVEGEVGGARIELYRIELQRTDRIEITMTTTSGNLDPHVTLFYGTSSDVRSESWSREGDSLIKEYLADKAGSYVVAARAYRNRGAGRYELTVQCAGGPCNGELPPPEPLDLDDAVECIQKARLCAFNALPGYNGNVGTTRASQIFAECVSTVSLSTGDSCAAACDYEEVGGDPARELCDAIVAELPFFADADQACLGVLDSCMADCYDLGDGGWHDDELWRTTESVCWSTGFNGTCPRFARAHSSCGGTLLEDGAQECYERCLSVDGAWADDTSDLCTNGGYDCESQCDVELDAAGAHCGGLEAQNAACLTSWLEDREVWLCDRALEDAIGN